MDRTISAQRRCSMTRRWSRRSVVAAVLTTVLAASLVGPVEAAEIRATGDLGVVIERTAGSILIVDQSDRAAIARIEGLGDLSHASVVFSPDQRFAFVFGRDGGLTKVDLITQAIAKRVVQAGNAIGGAISDDGALIAVSNYEPGGVRVFDADTLAPVAEIPTGSKTVGLVDAPGRRFVFSLWDDGRDLDRRSVEEPGRAGDHAYRRRWREPL